MQSTATQNYEQNIKAFIKLLEHYQRTIYKTFDWAGKPASRDQNCRLTHLIDSFSAAEDILPGLKNADPLQILMTLLPPIQLNDLSRQNPQGDRAIAAGKQGHGEMIDQKYKEKTGGFNSLSTFLNFSHRAITIKNVYEHLPANMQEQGPLAFCKTLGDDAETIRTYFQKPLDQVASAIWDIHYLSTSLSLQDKNQLRYIMQKEITKNIRASMTALPSHKEQQEVEKALNKIFQAISEEDFWASCCDLLQPSQKSQALSVQIKQDHSRLKNLSVMDAYESIKLQTNTLLLSINQQDEIPHTVIMENLPLLLATTTYISAYPETDLAQHFKTVLNTRLQDSMNKIKEDKHKLESNDLTTSSYSDSEKLARTFSTQCLVEEAETLAPAAAASMFPSRRPASAPPEMQTGQSLSISSNMENLLGEDFDWGEFDFDQAAALIDTPPTAEQSAITDGSHNSGIPEFDSANSLDYPSYNSIVELSNMHASAAQGDLSGATDPELSAISAQAASATADDRATTPPPLPETKSPSSVEVSPGSPTTTRPRNAKASSSANERKPQPLSLILGNAHCNFQFANTSADSKPSVKRKGVCDEGQNKSPRDAENQNPSTKASVLRTLP